ncbi:hypothetical protein COLAER_00258 [Collinsella aerofaciens ATCC 25986]|uniref:Uncharacterized protein n=1 Tax=Collinsella aerofaciens (strain ATCC 25986 / DSM 3979 / JCM 10188 / KCTC 3647 / NCTC 11838 / VPI 1003) TaxID=411903 RepID=A4E777_COLAA|nr:hypothetical protein [Collinsella aerofaciens]EBA40586.1 hypothetical protein COLAER_00258 [Collinsella aerofaciens ATCC 25986]QIA33057.1 hypothetical protein GXM19_01435 [Collinsella aerofaciens ATCC 25986]SUY68681.1 Uncharacterised protein [Collinsella aerofaciens]
MKLDNLNADEFQNAMCLLADVAEDVMNGELGAKAKASYAKFRSDSAKAKAKAKAKGDPEAAKAAATAEVNGLAVDMAAGLLPDVLRQCGEISYKLLAALDGQTLEEYKADFTVKKWVNDIKDAIDGIDGIKDILAPFFG